MFEEKKTVNARLSARIFPISLPPVGRQDNTITKVMKQNSCIFYFGFNVKIHLNLTLSN